MTDREWDRKLHIDTCGREDYAEDSDNYAYEPTDYGVLERLVQSGYIGREDHLVDYGCGKGRVSFFVHAKTGCRVTGVEVDELFLDDARKNLESFRKHGRLKPGHRGGPRPEGREEEQEAAPLRFVLSDARSFRVTDENRFYFFNPFSEKILRVVLERIIEAWYEDPREIFLFFYYPEDEYVARLLMTPELAFVDEIDCSDLYDGTNRRERILVFEMEKEGGE